MNQFYKSILCAATVMGIFTGPAAHAMFLGDVVTAQMEPNGTFWNATPSSETVVDPGAEFILTLQGNDAFEVDLTDTTIALTLIRPTGLGLGAGEELTLSGLSLPGVPNPFTISNPDSVSGIELADIALSGDTLVWNLNDTGTWLQGNQVVLTFIPEPTTLVILLGCAVAGCGMLRHI